MATDLTPATEQSSHELAELLLRCRPAVKAYLTKAEQAVLVVGTTYQEHYRPALEADANRMRDLLDKIDNLIPGPHSPPVVYDPKLGHLIDSKTGVRVEPRIPSATPFIGRRVVCAAVRSAEGYLILGIRHYSQDMHQQIATREDGNQFSHRHDDDQGFVDQHGTFMTREEAYQVALRAGQIIRPEACGEGKLYSEGLY